MAPEVLEQSGGYDHKADIWSFGITAIELAYGEAPYQRLHPLKVMKIIIEKDPPRMDRRKWDAPFVNLVEGCLQKDPHVRQGMDEVLSKHKKFFAKANDQPLLELLRGLPSLEQRIPPKPVWSPKQSQESREPVSGEWDFKLEEGDDDDGLSGLPECET